jgi:hypothetical protein
MNQIKKNPVTSLGYNFVPQEMLQRGQDEYFLRNRQNNNGIRYRGLTAYEIEVLVRNRNTSDNWNNILVSDSFNPEQVHNCKFYGLVRIGKLEPFYLEFKNLRRPVGLYNSTIISSDFGDNVVVDNVNYISHYIIGNEVIIVNVNELATTNYAKFGNGIIKDGEPESLRIYLEICNENGGRKVIPFDGMLPGDAYLWTQHRDDEKMQSKFREMTLKRFDTHRGHYGAIGDRTVIKNCKIIKDVNIGTDAYLKGANKLKNLTINSSAEANSQIGEGCELVNGIIDFGCRIFYGVKAVRFFMASHSQLKYGARLINSYLGNNSTISCCEVLNSLIFPFHEQHHNNSFLCAALLNGQTNIAAGATIGSNHNSRSPDGELIAGRGFWPGLCVSLKHNSKFASFTIIAKADYPAELNIPVPFSLVSNDVTNDQLVVMPAYWFMYNMYALARNSWKYGDRDKRTDKKQHIEYDFLAPDTVNEMIDALELFEKLVGDAWLERQPVPKEEDARAIGKKLLLSEEGTVKDLEVIAHGFENSNRKVRLIKVHSAYRIFRELILLYASNVLVSQIRDNKISSYDELLQSLPARITLSEWKNIGGQLIRSEEVERLHMHLKSGKIKTWNDVHSFYNKQAQRYPDEKLAHALAALKKVHGLTIARKRQEEFAGILQQSANTKQWMAENIFRSREKDYENPFREMVYSSQEEMNKVVGSLTDNPFIQQEREAANQYRRSINSIVKKFSLK